MPRSNLPEPRPFNIDRCIELHNMIVHAAIAQNSDIGVTRGYFNFHQRNSPHVAVALQQMRESFDEEFCRFLDGVDIPDLLPAGTRPDTLSFTPEIMGLASYWRMWDIDESYIKGTQYVWLYSTHDWKDGRGLMFDLETRSTTFFDTRDTSFEWNPDSDPQLWLSLDTVLEEWWSRIENGKYLPLRRQTERSPVGWTMAPFCQKDLDDTIQAWDRYIEAITSRLPASSEPVETQSSVPDLTPLVDEHHIRGFLRSLLLSARQPPATVRFIAPGLLVPSQDFLTHTLSRTQRWQKARDDRQRAEHLKNAVVPTTLFPLVSADGSVDPAAPEGLILGVSGRYWADSVALMLPADTASFPPWLPKPMADRKLNPLFQPGCCPYGFDHSVQLKLLLHQWTELIEKGVWTVGAEGVEGGRDWLISRRNKIVAEREGLVLELPCGL